MDSSQLHFYPPAIRDIIEHAKQFSHCNLASINSFPMCPQFNTKASEYINEAIVERRRRGLVIPNGWWPQYTSDIAKLLWEDVGNWQSSLKKKARNFVCEHYQWDLQNRRPVNADIAKALLVGGTFLKDGWDEENHTNNLAHPALTGLVIKFFYTGPNTVGNLFPEIFANEVPCATVTLAATAVIKLALDEVAAEGKEVMFK
ncbi:hypothetical protein OG21DRAFT_1491756 [Imleria badia]|nr:hypothetical protein OG21DRAFT_1491756 [Imleria badia]